MGRHQLSSALKGRACPEGAVPVTQREGRCNIGLEVFMRAVNAKVGQWIL